MLCIKLADINILIDTESKYIKDKCRDYIACFDKADITVKITDDEIKKERKVCPGFSRDYYEFICVYRNICLKMPLFNRLLVHSAAIDASGRGYAFAAKSGVGKSTHIKMWAEAFDDVTVINGDKPIYSIENGKVRAYGTPWCGKEGYQVNTSTELRAICLVHRGEENRIEKIDSGSAVNFLFNQILMPKSADAAIKTLELCSELLERIQVYELYCNISTDAARIAREALDKA